MGGCISQPSDYACIEDNCQSYPPKRGSCPFCKDHEEPTTQFQLVILGPGYTGKTTLRQHLVQRYGHAFYHGDLLMYRDILQHNVLDLFRDLLNDPSMQISDARAFTKEHQKIEKEKELEESESESEKEEVEGYLDCLMKKLEDQDLKYGRDNARFLLDNCEKILQSDYSPKFSDLLHCHVRSTGLMFENHVLCKDLPLGPGRQENLVFRVVDVGGHRNERKKWNYVLQQDNDVIVFVVSATSFCQVLFEDFRTNSLRESLVVWNNLLQSPYVSSSSCELILVLNKIDLFRERHHLLAKYFPEFTEDPNDFDECLSFVKSLFFDIAKTHEQKIHFVTTQLTDEHEIDAFDMDRIRTNIEQSQLGSALPSELMNMIIEFTVGHSVFWSRTWLQQMWEKKHSAEREKEIRELRKIDYNNTKDEFCMNYSYDPNNPHDVFMHRARAPYYTPAHLLERPYRLPSRVDSDSEAVATPTSAMGSSPRSIFRFPRFQIGSKKRSESESESEAKASNLNGPGETSENVVCKRLSSGFDHMPLLSRSSSASSLSSFFGSISRTFRASSSVSSSSVLSSSSFDFDGVMERDGEDVDTADELEICESDSGVDLDLTRKRLESDITALSTTSESSCSSTF